MTQMCMTMTVTWECTQMEKYNEMFKSGTNSSAYMHIWYIWTSNAFLSVQTSVPQLCSLSNGCEWARSVFCEPLESWIYLISSALSNYFETSSSIWQPQ